MKIAKRHYSQIWRGNQNHKRFVGPGKRMIILDPLCQWLFVWRMAKYRMDNQEGVECTIFRNESNRLSSDIILEAEKLWNDAYGATRKYTYIHPGQIKSCNPGYCFLCAGWKRTGHTSTRGLILLEKD
jgi:hypothetical protein